MGTVPLATTAATPGAVLGHPMTFQGCQGHMATGVPSHDHVGPSQRTILDNATPPVAATLGRPKKAAKYDGKTGWADHRVQFNIAARLNSWDDSQKVMELATSLECNARAILADLSPD